MMKTEDKAMNRRMSFVLWFLVVAVPFYMLGLHFYFSSKGALASCAIAAVASTLGVVALEKHRRMVPIFTLLAPFIFIACLSLYCPTASTVIYGLAAICLYMGLLFTRRRNQNPSAGGRGELAMDLKSISDESLATLHCHLLRRWSALGLLGVLLYAFIPSPWFAFVPVTAIAAGLSSVLNSHHTRESR